MMDISFNDDYAKEFVSNSEIDSLQKNIDRLHVDLEEKQVRVVIVLDGCIYLLALLPHCLIQFALLKMK